MKNETNGPKITVLEAIETLSNIVEWDAEEFDSFLHQLEETDINLDEYAESKVLEGVTESPQNETIDRVKEVFSVIFNYVQGFYKETSMYTRDKKTVDGIKDIMLLVGEAAKKVEKFANNNNDVYDPCVTSLPEYQKLQQFYHQKIDRKIDQSVLGEWFLAVAGQSVMKDTLHDLKIQKRKILKKVYVDLDSVKNDGMYELLQMEKQDGSHFYSMSLIRNMKLACDFGITISQEEYYDALDKIGYWRDRIAHYAADTLLSSCGNRIADFYRIGPQNKSDPLVRLLNKSVFALMLSANPYNLKHRKTLKSCSSYFADHQHFLRELLDHRDYQLLALYSPEADDIIGQTVLDTVQSLLNATFTKLSSIKGFSYTIDNLLEDARHRVDIKGEVPSETARLSQQLEADYKAIINLLKFHANGPLKRSLEFIDNGVKGFDTIMQGNVPNYLCQLHNGDYKLTNLRLPSPTKQVTVDQANITDEFRGYLFSLGTHQSTKHHLLINLQNRLSWQEHARCSALEHIQNSSLFKEALTVVTLATDNEFYHQLGAFRKLDNIDEFKMAFLNQITSKNGGYYFPDECKEKICSDFAGEAIDVVQKLVFTDKESLTLEERQSYISLVHALIELKLIDIIKPDCLSLTCKDGIDESGYSNGVLFLFLKMISREILDEPSREYLNSIIYGPAILIRERPMRPEEFNRLMCIVRCLESARHTQGFQEFSKRAKEILSPLYQQPIFNWHFEL